MAKSPRQAPHRRPWPLPLAVAVLAALCPFSSFPAIPPPLESLAAAPLASPPALDGCIEPEAWGEPAFPFLSELRRPMPARDATRVWIDFSSDTLALALDCDEAELEESGPSLAADSPAVLAGSHAWIRIAIRTPPKSKDAETSGPRDYIFAIEPGGAIYDSRNGDPAWNGLWQSAAARSPGAWSAELLIPFTTLEIVADAPPAELEIDLRRTVVAAQYETQGWPWRPFDSSDEQLGRIVFAPASPPPLPAESVPFWDGWRTRQADYMTSASELLARLEPEECLYSRRFLAEGLERAAMVDPQTARSAPSEPILRSLLQNLETRIGDWLSDLKGYENDQPSAPDRIVPIKRPSAAGRSWAVSLALLCGQELFVEPVPLVVNLHPGDEMAERYAERFMKWRQYSKQPFIMLIPRGGGLQTRHAYDGEDEIFEAIEALQALYPIDPARIYLMGYSMGAVAAQRIAAQTPDLFAGVIAIAGAGLAERVENLGPLPVWLYHGEKDTQVPPSFNLEWEAERKRLAAPGDLTLIPGAGHDILDRVVDEKLWDKAFAARRQAAPEQVRFRPVSLRHSRAYWVRIDRFAAFPPQASVALSALPGNVVEGTAQGVAALTVLLQPPLFSPDLDAKLVLNGQVYYEGPYRPSIQAELIPPPPARPLKTPQRGGPMDEAFRGPALYVWGTQGPALWTEALAAAARRAAIRPGFAAEPIVLADNEIPENLLPLSNLFLFGAPAQNRIAAQLEKSLSPAIGPEGIRVAGKTYPGPDIVAQFICPSPYSPERYCVLHWANAPQTMRQADWFQSPYRFRLLPDGVIDRLAPLAPGLPPVRQRIAEFWFGEDWKSVALSEPAPAQAQTAAEDLQPDSAERPAP